ncbi:ATP-dependent RNA helicase DHX30 isoform X1 [Megalopta genalis]|uniref:ATP-dependent RNA helicase DHX30 isoform X1 n=1 Tax=Megalopta genalis TaxID=115081 RepID=UPI003FD11381
MSLFQVISTLRKPIYCYLRIHHKSQLYKTCFESIQLCSRVLYCSYNKDSEIYPHISSHNKLQDDSDDVDLPKKEMEHWDKEVRKMFANQQISKKYVVELLTNPVQHLHSIYDIVKNEFGNKDCITYGYENITPRKIKCTINISWPNEISFFHISSNKKMAMLHASKECLMWLYTNGYIEQSKPVLYNKNEIMSYVSKNYIKINLNPKFENDVQAMLDVYTTEIQPIVESSSNIVNTVDDSVESMVSPDSIDSKSERRNSILLKKLFERTRESNLPIIKFKSQILKSIDENQVLLIKGDTGCGKSTQVPQFIMDAYIQAYKAHECNILVSEPRKISAVTLAQRIAHEREEAVGKSVGFHVRLSHIIPPTKGSILFCTTGIFLRRIQQNPTLEGVSHVIIDEAHERTLQIDILLNIMKKLLRIKPRLKLIIMSATVNTELFQQYFQCTSIEIPGKMYPVETYFVEDIERKTGIKIKNTYDEIKIPVNELLCLILWIAKNKPYGSILCFLPGWREIQNLRDTLEESHVRNLHILPFHSKLTNVEQKQVFEAVSNKVRKIILATDIAESSITIPDVKYVIDTVRKRDIIWDTDSCSYTITTHWVSKANILQRRGRAGRVSPGESYHFITKDIYNQLNEFPEPEIRRISLEQAVITSKIFSNETIKEFFGSMIEQPNETSLFLAVECLKDLGILDQNENVTPLGRRIMYFSLDVKLSKAIIFSYLFQSLDPMLTLVTILSSDNESSPTSLVNKTTKRRRKTEHHNSSDHIGMIETYKKLEQNFKELDYVYERSQDFKEYDRITQIRELHLDGLFQNGMFHNVEGYEIVNEHNKQKELLRAILFSATNQLLRVFPYGFKNKYFSKRITTIRTEDNKTVVISTESVNYKRQNWPSKLLTYVARVHDHESRRCVVYDTSLISPLSVLLFSQGEVFFEKVQQDDSAEDKNVTITINNLKNLTFVTDERSARILLDFRSVLWNVMNYLIKYEGASKEAEHLKYVKLYKNRLLHVVLDIINDSASNIDSSVEVSDLEHNRRLEK